MKTKQQIQEKIEELEGKLKFNKNKLSRHFSIGNLDEADFFIRNIKNLEARINILKWVI